MKPKTNRKPKSTGTGVFDWVRGDWRELTVAEAQAKEQREAKAEAAEKDRRRKKRLQDNIGKAAAGAALKRIVAASASSPLPAKQLLEVVMSQVRSDAFRWIANRRKLDRPQTRCKYDPRKMVKEGCEESVRRYAATLNETDSYGLVIELLSIGWGAYTGYSGFGQQLKLTAKAYGIDLKQCAQRAAYWMAPELVKEFKKAA